MSENDKPEAAKPATPVYPKPKIGQDDHNQTVSTAADEPMSGIVADITDGDTHHKKHK